MWEQYKRNFAGVQLVMFFVAGSVLLRTHVWVQAFVFLAVMQACALLGAAWGARLKRKLTSPEIHWKETR